jgi:hypothetical protein
VWGIVRAPEAVVSSPEPPELGALACGAMDVDEGVGAGHNLGVNKTRGMLTDSNKTTMYIKIRS